jgi:hypothetical protein
MAAGRLTLQAGHTETALRLFQGCPSAGRKGFGMSGLHHTLVSPCPPLVIRPWQVFARCPIEGVPQRKTFNALHRRTAWGVQSCIRQLSFYSISNNIILWAVLPGPAVRPVLGWPPIGSRVVENINPIFPMIICRNVMLYYLFS